MEEASKILFCDIDGCLTSIDTGTYFSTDAMQYGPSQKIVNSIIKFCRDNNAKVVISSNWRKFEDNGVWTNSLGTFVNPLLKVKSMLGDCFIGTLPKTRHTNKSQALKLWLDDTKYSGKFAIFDDDLKERFQDTIEYGICNKFILVDPLHGITDCNLNAAKKILESKK